MNSTGNNITSFNSDSFLTRTLVENESWLKRVLFNRLENSEEVEEVFQEVGLAVARSESENAVPDNPAAWLYRVAIRQALQFRRKAGRYKKRIERVKETASSTTHIEEDPLAIILAAERQSTIRAALRELSEMDREVLILKYAENWTYQQLADKLGVSKNTIEFRLIQAKKRLRQLLKEHEEAGVL